MDTKLKDETDPEWQRISAELDQIRETISSETDDGLQPDSVRVHPAGSALRRWKISVRPKGKEPYETTCVQPEAIGKLVMIACHFEFAARIVVEECAEPNDAHKPSGDNP